MYSGTVKDQGLCGSCYAFAAADTISALNAINIYSFFVPLSAQQIVDCIDNGLTYGCNGGYL
jgi:C1A family cysteine protease